MKRIIWGLIVTVLLFTVVFTQTRNAEVSDKEMQRVKQFESDWIIAGLNRNESWLSRFYQAKLAVLPKADGIESRAEEIARMIDSATANNPLGADNLKVRVTGNISVFGGVESESGGNMVAGNRAYYFLDTLNKRGGKWEIIATHFSRVPEKAGEKREPANSPAQIEQELLKLHRAKDEAESKRDTALLDRLLDDDFMFIDANGSVSDKKKFLDEIKGGTTSSGTSQNLTYEEFKARLYPDTAVVNYNLLVPGRDGENSSNPYRTSAVWIKENGNWRITNFHATRVRS